MFNILSNRQIGIGQQLPLAGGKSAKWVRAFKADTGPDTWVDHQPCTFSWICLICLLTLLCLIEYAKRTIFLGSYEIDTLLRMF